MTTEAEESELVNRLLKQSTVRVEYLRVLRTIRPVVFKLKMKLMMILNDAICDDG